jgi:hypothetical protein
MHSPQEIDDKSLALHQLVVQKIKREPVLFARIQENLDRRKAKPTLGTLPHVMHWQRLVDEGMEHALSVAIEKSDRGQVLRQCSPFTRILTESERLDFIQSWPRNPAQAGSQPCR